MALKITAADRWFSRCIRERASWRCERCGRQYPETSTGLHCSHFWGRDTHAVRVDPENAAAHCYGCHRYLEKRPREFDRWIEEYLGQERAEALDERARKLFPKWKLYIPEQAAHYKAEYERMRHERAGGRRGRIEFAAWVNCDATG